MDKKYINTEFKEGVAVVKLNPLFYSQDVIFSAAYAMVEKAYFTFDGEPDKEIKVYITPKEGFEAEKLSLEFKNELLTYLEHKMNHRKNKDLRQVILQRALLTSSSPESGAESFDEGEFDNEFLDDPESADLLDDDSDYADDPLGIAVPWDEKYSSEDANEDDKTADDLLDELFDEEMDESSEPKESSSESEEAGKEK
ncbi:MAG: hypothetical protein ACQESF_06615 [Nanobdellota archaeon]